MVYITNAVTFISGRWVAPLLRILCVTCLPTKKFYLCAELPHLPLHVQTIVILFCVQPLCCPFVYAHQSRLYQWFEQKTQVSKYTL